MIYKADLHTHSTASDGQYTPLELAGLIKKRGAEVWALTDHDNKEDMEFEFYWDGACSADKIQEYAPKEVRGFVLGTTLLFGKGMAYSETIQNIRELKF